MAQTPASPAILVGLSDGPNVLAYPAAGEDGAFGAQERLLLVGTGDRPEL